MRLPILVLHICAGTLGLLSGSVAMAVRKGSRQHRLAGNIFFISMISLAVSAVCLSFMKHQISNVFGGTLTFYLVFTAWLTARRSEAGMLILDYVLLVIALGVAAGEMTYFLGQQQVFPAAVRNTPILPILTFLPIGTMIFWLLRVGLSKAYKGKWMPRRSDAYSLPN